MAEPKTAAHIEEKGHEPDKNEDPLEGVKTRMDGHEHRITRLENHVGLKPEPDVAKEENGKHMSKTPRMPNRERARH